MLTRILSTTETRVLGSLIEKELSTPDHYPLSLNALTAACNQSSNRDPVMVLDAAAVSAALDGLRRASLVRSFQSSGSRVPKYSHLLAESFDLSRAELAVLCVLSLRGPQTLAEVKSRVARLLPGDDAEAAEPALETLIARTPTPAVVRLSRRAGQKEARFAHLLAGEVSNDANDASDARDAVDAQSANAAASSKAAGSTADRIASIEEQVQEVRRELANVRAEFAEFRKQFE